MTDSALRALERAHAEAPNDVAAEVRLLEARLRAGVIDRDRLCVAAILGDPPARAVVGEWGWSETAEAWRYRPDPETEARQGPEPPLSLLVRRVRTVSAEGMARCLVAACRLLEPRPCSACVPYGRPGFYPRQRGWEVVAEPCDSCHPRGSGKVDRRAIVALADEWLAGGMVGKPDFEMMIGSTIAAWSMLALSIENLEKSSGGRCARLLVGNLAEQLDGNPVSYPVPGRTQESWAALKARAGALAIGAMRREVVPWAKKER